MDALFGKGTKLYSIFAFKCPKCHEGRVFQNSNPFALRDLFKMDERCSVCGHKFEPEPGYWFGAMYVSYGLNIALWVTLFVAIYTLTSISLELFLGIGIVTNLALVPYFFRLARSIWMNFFVKYDPEAGRQEGDDSGTEG